MGDHHQGGQKNQPPVHVGRDRGLKSGPRLEDRGTRPDRFCYIAAGAEKNHPNG
jgi:hypothetical protein